MAKHTLYAYVDGSDLHDIVGDVEAHLERFVEETPWHIRKPWLVNQRRETDPSLSPGDLPDWEVGLNLELPEPGLGPSGWFQDVVRLANFLGELHALFGRDFVIGIADGERRISEDLFFITSRTPDLVELRQIIGIEEEAV
jgi:hypothetical protein